MWLTDKSMDGMVGQVQNCLFCQTPSVIKCGISLVLSRYRDLINHYSTVRVRPTLSDITVIRLSVLATLLTNWHDNTKLISRRRSINGDAVDCKSATFGYDWFDPSSLHQIRLVSIMVITADCLSAYGSSILPRVAKSQCMEVVYPLGLISQESQVRILPLQPALQLITASVIRTRETD